jgi:peptide/nickel transport system substrate-binding protein
MRALFGLAAGALLLCAATAEPARAQADTRPDLVIAVDNLWPTMEPVIGISTTGGRIHPSIYDTLAVRDFVSDPAGTELKPSLAVAWERRSPTVWEIRLREGVKFHNGETMTAADVAFTLSEERLWGQRPIAPRGRSFARGFKRVEATGPLTVEIETAAPDPTMPSKLALMISYVVPEKYYREVGHDQFGLRPVGTGPYRVVSFNSGEAIRLEAFDQHWAGRPPAKSLTFRIVPEFSARLAGLVSGEFDFIVGVPFDQREVVRRFDGVTLVDRAIENYPMFAFDTLPFPDGGPANPLTNADLRKAMVMAIDMDAITEALWGDATFTPTAPFNYPEYGPNFFDPNRKGRYTRHDPAAAREHLARSGYRGEELRWHIVRGFFPNYESAAEIMVEQWKEVGINVQMIVVENFDLAYQRPFHLLNMSMSSEFSGDPMRPLWVDWGPGSNRVNAAHKTWVPTERFLELGRAFEAAVDPAERRAAYLALVEEWEEITPAMYLWRNLNTFAHKSRFEWIPTATGVMNFDAAYFRVRN